MSEQQNFSILLKTFHILIFFGQVLSNTGSDLSFESLSKIPKE